MHQSSLEADVLPRPRQGVAEVAARGPVSGAAAARARALEERAGMERRMIARSPLGDRPRAPMSELRKRLIRLCLKTTGLWPRGRRNAHDVRVRTADVRIAGLPRRFDGYRLLQISDPHFDAAPGLGDAIVAAVAGVEADLCVLTGDYRDAEEPAFTEFHVLEPLAAIAAQVRARDGILAILGNHDAAAMVPHIEDLGIRVLLNETIQLARGGEVLRVTGLDDVHAFYTPMAADALAAEAGSDACRIALVHSAEMAGEAAAAGFALYLAGHCHGGQICLPGGRPLLTHLHRHADLHTGLWRVGDMIGYTSRGAGVCGVPVRYNCPGEVTLFTLKAAA